MSEEKHSGGRPRDADAAASIKAATLKLVRERGYNKVSIAAIASAAGVARQTLYNRWSTKADLVLEAVFEETGHYADAPLQNPNKSCKLQLEAFLIQVFTHLDESGSPIRSLIAAAQEDPAFREALRERFVKPREVLVIDLLQRAQDQGELSRTRDVKMLSNFIHGAFWYALLNGEPVDARLARDIANEIFVA